MKIAVDARSLLTPQPRGEGRALRHLYEHIALLRPAWEIALFGETTCPRYIAAANVSQRVLTIPGFRFNVWENFALPIAAKASRFTLLHGAGSSLPRVSTIPAVITVHDIIPLILDDGQSKFAKDRFRLQLECGLRSARVIIAVSSNTKRDLVSVFGVEPERIDVIHWGVHAPTLEEFQALPGESQPAFPGEYLIAFAGEAPRKNTEGLMRAFARLPSAGPRLLLVGLSSASARRRYGEIAADLGCDQRIVMLDYVDDAMLDRLLRGALALLYVSFYEGFGLPLLEAMARGVPVVAANTSSIPEVVGDAGLLVDPTRPQDIAEAVMELIGSRDRRHEFSARGLGRAKTFSWQATAQRTIHALEAAAANPTGPSIRRGAI